MWNEDRAREEIEGILNGREYKAYQEESKGLIQIWWEQLKEWFANLLDKLFPTIEVSRGFSGTVLFIIIAVTLILLLLLTFFLIRNDKRKKPLHHNKPLQTMNEMHWTYGMHLTEATNRETMGEYRLATRHMFLALLLYFHEKEWLTARIWKTNWEYYDELQKVNQQWANQFYSLALIFDEVTYGERIMQQEEYIRFKNGAMKWLSDEQTLEVRRKVRGKGE
jgi:hypothetical protein